MNNINWEVVRRIFLEILNDILEKQEEDVDEFLSEYLQKEEISGGEANLIKFTAELVKGVYEAIQSITQTLSELTGEDLSPVVEEVLNEVYPDGLKLSERLWDWDSETRRTVAQIIAQGIRTKKTAQRIAYEIEGRLIAEGKLEESPALKYLEEIRKLLELNVKDPKDRRKLQKFIKKLERTLKRLPEARYAERKTLIKQLREALEKESERLMKRAVEVYLKKESLRRLQTITQTELVNTFHKVQIRATEKDEDLIGYKWKLPRAHPRPDICDVYANVNFGLGRGVWPKERVPRRKPHPHCLCYLLPVYSTKKKKPKEIPEYDLKPLIKQHKYLKALDELGFPLQKVIDLDPETGHYIREREFLEKFKISEREWETIKKAFTSKRLRKLAERLGVGTKSIYREGSLIKHPLREEYTKVVKVVEDLLGNERVLTEMTIKHIKEEINFPKRKTKWQAPYREWGLKNIEKILANPDKIIFHKPSETFYYVKEYKNAWVAVVVDKQGYIYTVFPIKTFETKPKDTYIVIYES